MQTDNHTKLAGIELHQYVEQFLVDETSNICEKPKEKCLNKMTDCLKLCARVERNSCKHCLKHHMFFG